MAAIPKGVAAVLSSLQGGDFLSSSDFSAKQTAALLDLASQLKKGDRRIDLGNRVLGLIFTKASTRTRVSFQVAMARLGGQTVDLNPKLTQLGRGEPLEDTARALSRFCDVLAVRTYGQEELENYANWSSIPVINALTDLEHPCQALADFFTMQEVFGKLEGKTLSYVGDGNNVASSLSLISGHLGLNFTYSSPSKYQIPQLIFNQAKNLSLKKESVMNWEENPNLAVKDADIIYTDKWVSMGMEKESEIRIKDFKNYQVNKKLMQKAKSDAIFMHCLPVGRGEEVTDEVIDGKQSVVWRQALNRVHAQKSIINWCFN